MSLFYETVDLLQATSIAELHVKTEKLCQNLQFESFLYGMRTEVPGQAPKDFIFSAYPQAWWEKYLSEDLIRVNPVMKYAFPSMLPYVWGSGALTPRESEFMEEAHSYGLSTGVTLPVHKSSGEAGLLSLTRPDQSLETSRDIVNRLGEAQLVAVYLHEAIRNLIKDRSNPHLNNIKLAPRELECLKWVCAGKTAWETSVILSISLYTVQGYLKEAYAKLGVRSQKHAIAKAISLQLLHP